MEREGSVVPPGISRGPCSSSMGACVEAPWLAFMMVIVCLISGVTVFYKYGNKRKS